MKKYLLINKVLTISIIFSIILSTALINNTIHSLASSASVSFYTEKTQMEEGEVFYVYVNINSSSNIGYFETSITYNSEVLEYIEGSSKIKSSDGLLTITDNDQVNITKQKKYVMKFRAKTAGNSEFVIRDEVKVLDYDSNLEMSVASTKLAITIAESKKLSDNNKLTSLITEGVTLYPEFDPDITAYNAEIKGEISKININPIAQDLNAKIEIIGNEQLNYGLNIITISVTSEIGNVKQYTINATKKMQETVTSQEEIPTDGNSQNNTNDEIATNNLSQIHLTKEDNKTYIQGNYRYEILELEDMSILPEGYTERKTLINDMEVTSYVKDNLEQNDFILLYAANQYNEKSLYQYDTTEKTIQRYLKPIIIKENAKSTFNDESNNDKLNNNTMLIVALLGMCIILSIISLNLFAKSRGIKDDEFI